MIVIYTDGSCQGNGKTYNTGGYGIVVYQDNKIINAHGNREENTTNNIQELKAILWAMIHYGQEAEIPIVYTDSSYAFNTLTSWMFNWQKAGWLKSNGKSPENLDLIQAYYYLIKKGYKINLHKVSGHSGITGNELADKIAIGKINPKDLINGEDIND